MVGAQSVGVRKVSGYRAAATGLSRKRAGLARAVAGAVTTNAIGAYTRSALAAGVAEQP